MSAPQHLLHIGDLTQKDVLALLEKAEKIKAAPQTFSTSAQGKLLSLVFAEPSTRTFHSFSAAMQRLGGGMLEFRPDSTSSIEKGESWSDTLKVLGGYVDVMAVRSHNSELMETAVKVAGIPIINAGNGGNGEHPTQALLDAFTIQEKFGKLDVHIAFYGDLKNARTARSLMKLLHPFGSKFTCIAPAALQMEAGDIPFETAEKLEDVLPSVDILYTNRLRKEYASQSITKNDLTRLDGEFAPITTETMKHLSQDAFLMEPLPRAGQIDPSVDSDPRAIYFEQAKNGMWMRMALLLNALKV